MQRSKGPRSLPRAAVVAVCVLACAGDAMALTDEEIFRRFAFDFVGPGARALGLGGAFVGLADDVAATHVNPAGLTAITSPEFMAEFGVRDRDLEVTSGESGSLDVDAETCVRALRNWSMAAGEIQAEERVSAQDGPAEGTEHEQT